MVSLRKRRLLGLCSGVQNCVLPPFPRFCDNGHSPDKATHSTNPVSVHPIPMDDTKQPMEVNKSLARTCMPKVSGSGLSKDRTNHSYISGSSSSKEQNSQPTSEPEFKRRKQHRRKNLNNQEKCVMRGVYFKNMKWQAAIKVDKRQIHLGTVGSQEEAARLYDRAAFMCGREPNFEIPEYEKKELRQFKWDEFLAITRTSLTNKKTKRRNGSESQAKPEPSVQNSDPEGTSNS